MLLEVLVHMLVIFFFLILLDSHEQSNTRTAVPPVAPLLTDDLPDHSCNSQTVSTYCISQTGTVSAVTAVTVLKSINVSPSVQNSYFLYSNIFILSSK